MKRLVLQTLAAAAILSAAAPALAQTPPAAAQAPQGRQDALDPSPVDPAKDPNVDLFLNDWRNAAPRTMYGALQVRDILSHLAGTDPPHPLQRGALLRDMTAISYAVLDGGATAQGRVAAGNRHTVYTSGGKGRITVAGKTYELKEGAAFFLRPTYDFRIEAQTGAPLNFYIRSDDTLPDAGANDPFSVVNRFDADKRMGIHWSHVQSGGLPGMLVITLAPGTLPHPHSHSNEEVWMQIKGETLLSIGKTLRPMSPGQAIRIPPTGMTAHSNINPGDEPVEMIVMIANGSASKADYAQLDSVAFNPATHADAEMYMGGWRTSIPRIMHGAFYFRDMLTGLQGADPLHPTRKGAVLTGASAVSYAQLEPGTTAHRIDGQLNGVQQTFVVQSGTGTIVTGGRTVELSKGMSFVLTPGADFRLTATGERYMNFYVVTEPLNGAAPAGAVRVVDRRSGPEALNAWTLTEQDLVRREDGLIHYKAITAASQPPRSMTRPYSVAPGGEEIWIATEGEVQLLLGKQLIKLPAGTAFAVPPSGSTAQAKLNPGEAGASYLYFAR